MLNNQEKSNTKRHGLTNHRLFKIWSGMKYRVLNKKNKNYSSYGGRGITIYDEWIYDFKTFYEWSLANGYDSSLSIDRINNDGNYEPSNCRWTNSKVQARNRRVLNSANTSGYKGIYYRKETDSWRARIKINYKNIHICYCKNAIDAAMAYDKYVKDNNLEHTTNGLL